MSNFLIVGTAFTWVIVLVGGWFGWQLLRQNGRILLRLDELEKRFDEIEFGDADEPEGLPVGTDAPAFELPDLAGGRKTLAQFRGQPLLLIFFNPACGFCREMSPKLAALPLHPVPLPLGGGEGERSPGEGLPHLLVITTGDADANRQLFDEHKLSCPVLLQKQSEVATAYQANGTPSGYLIGPEGKITSELTMGAEALLELAARKSDVPSAKSEVGQSPHAPAAGNGDDRAERFSKRSLARSKIKRDGLKAGSTAPGFRLPRLDGSELSLEELCGRRVLLVFSDPQCGPCNALVPQLQQFHREQPAVSIVMISRGEPKENRAKVKEQGLTFPVVLQRQWEISRLYAMFATPMAYLIDEAGVIMHDVAVGLEPIQALMAKARHSSRE